MAWRLVLQSPGSIDVDACVAAVQRVLPTAKPSLVDASAFDVALAAPIAGATLRSLRALLEAYQVDCNQLPDAWRWQDVGLIGFDMDGTLITIECIDEMAKLAGVGDEVSAITAAAMRGELDFAQALRKRVSLLAGLPRTALATVYETKLHLMPGALALTKMAKEQGTRLLLASGGFTYFANKLQALLGLDETHANELAWRDDQLTGDMIGSIVDANTKARAFASARKRLAPGQLTIAVGDGANDLPMLRGAHIGIAFHAKPKVNDEAEFVLRFCDHSAIPRLLNQTA